MKLLQIDEDQWINLDKVTRISEGPDGLEFELPGGGGENMTIVVVAEKGKWRDHAWTVLRQSEHGLMAATWRK